MTIGLSILALKIHQIYCEIYITGVQYLHGLNTVKNKLELPLEIDTHHLFYHKSEYKKRYEKQFRNSVGFLIPTVLANHRMLHRELYNGVPKFTKDEMGDCLDYLDETHPSQKTNRFWGAEAVQRFTIIKEFDNEADIPRYQETRDHIALQIGILSRKLSGIEFPTVEELYRYGRPI